MLGAGGRKVISIATTVTYEEAFSPRRAFRMGLYAVKQAPLLLVGGALLMLFTEADWASLGMLAPADDPAFQDAAPGSRVVGALCCLSILWMALLVLQSWLHPGYMRAQLAALRAESAGAKVLFSGGDRFGAMLRWKLLAATLTLGATIVGALPGVALAAISGGEGTLGLVAGLLAVAGGAFAWIYVFLGIWLGDRVVTFERVGARQALRRSWALARGHRPRLFLFFAGLLALGLAGALGMLLFCVGALVTVPLARGMAGAALTDAYLRVASQYG